MPKKTRDDHVKAAAKALCDLNIFAAVRALMESSLVTSDCHAAESRIVAICNEQTAKALVRYDRARASASR